MIRRKLFAATAAGIIGMAVYGGSGIASAHEGHDLDGAAGQAAAAEKASKEENVLCPVTGEKADPDAKLTYTYKGKVYHFCCASCIADFKKDPEKYIRKMKKDAPGVQGHDHD